MANLIQLQKYCAPFLTPLAKGYAACTALRAALYRSGFFSSAKSPIPCISVGNIAVGGTGKTPVVSWLLTQAEHSGQRAVVLTRGYGGHSNTRPLLVTQTTSPDQCGDEPLMLAQTHPNSRIVADPKRARAMHYALAHLCPELFILDDGMQHLAVQRDINLTLLRATDVTNGWDAVLPAGRWREGASALNRADAFLLRIEPNAERLHEFSLSPELMQACAQRLLPLQRPIFPFFLRPTALRPLMPSANIASCQTKMNVPLPSAGYTLCTAVGTPDSVIQSATMLMGHRPDTVWTFPDHHFFTPQDLRPVLQSQKACIVTEKDAVKLQKLINDAPEFPTDIFYALQTEICFESSLTDTIAFQDWLHKRLTQLKKEI